MPERKTTAEAMQDLKDAARPIFEPPLLRMVEALQRHIDRHPRFYRAVRVIR